MTPPRRVLFVCTGNTCRSPMAEALLRTLAKAKGLELTVSSRGTNAMFGAAISTTSGNVLAEIGIDGSTHRARPVERPDLDQADIIFVMEQNHRDNLLHYHPDVAEKIFLLRAFADDQTADGEVPDPIGLPLEDYRRTRDILQQAIQRIVNKWSSAQHLSQKE